MYAFADGAVYTCVHNERSSFQPSTRGLPEVWSLPTPYVYVKGLYFCATCLCVFGQHVSLSCIRCCPYYARLFACHVHRYMAPEHFQGTMSRATVGQGKHVSLGLVPCYYAAGVHLQRCRSFGQGAILWPCRVRNTRAVTRSGRSIPQYEMCCWHVGRICLWHAAMGDGVWQKAIRGYAPR